VSSYDQPLSVCSPILARNGRAVAPGLSRCACWNPAAAAMHRIAVANAAAITSPSRETWPAVAAFVFSSSFARGGPWRPSIASGVLLPHAGGPLEVVSRKVTVPMWIPVMPPTPLISGNRS